MLRLIALCLLGISCLVEPTWAISDVDVIELENGDLSEGTRGWSVTTAGWSLVVKRDTATDSKFLRFTGPGGMGIYARTLNVEPFRGHLLRVRTRVRVKEGELRAQLWARVDRDDGEKGYFDNMSDRPVLGHEWVAAEHYIVLSEHASKLVFGGLCFGEGTADFRPVIVEDLGVFEGLETGRPKRLSASETERLVALARLLGVVRFFHPNETLSTLDWELFSVHAVDQVRAASSSGELLKVLRELMAVVAPRVQIYSERSAPELVAVPELSAQPSRDFVYVWSHHGFGLHSSHYVSKIERFRRVEFEPAQQDPDDPMSQFPALGEVWEGELGLGLRARVPLTYLVRVGEPLETPNASEWDPEDLTLLPRLRIADRSTRLASVIMLWATMQHFYPYFDVVDASWEAQLEPSLRAAAVSPGLIAQLGVLRALAAQLNDGHVWVSHSRDVAQRPLPLAWEWIEGQLVVTAVHASVDQIEVGDVIERIDSRPVTALLEEREREISAATDRARRRSAANNLLFGTPDQAVELRVRHAARSHNVSLRYSDDFVREFRPAAIAQLEEGVMYADLTRLDDEAWEFAWPKLANARGLVFDMRGFPRDLSSAKFFAPLVSENTLSPQWHSPHFARPDRDGATYVFSNWSVKPGEIHFTAPMAFLIDERAISYAETCLGIIEHYKLGALVGQPSAGTNGNTTSAQLPGGFSVSFTGMRVLKHDGSQHHGIGVLPTHPVERTRKAVAEGRDELIEEALAVVLGKR